MRSVPYVCDLDGVVWLADVAIAGAAEAIAVLRARGERVVFVTNNSAVPVGEQEAKLARFGIPAHGDVLTSAMAAAPLLRPGDRAIVIGGAGIIDELTGRGVEIVPGGLADAVVVGLDLNFTYQRLAIASTAIRDGARFIVTNDDSTYPAPGGLVPGAGSLAAAIATAAGRGPDVVAGKPHQPMVDLVHTLLGPAGMVIGDRDDTDGAFARNLGYGFALVLSGVLTEADVPRLEHQPDLVASDLSALVAFHLTRT